MTIPTGYAQITASFGGVNAPTGAACVFGIQNIPDDDADVIASGVWSGFAAFVEDVCTTDINLDEVLVKLGPDATGASATFSGTGGVGAQGTTSLGPNTAYLFTKNTALGGRRGRGRMFVPGCSETIVDDSGVLDGAAVTQLNTASADLLVFLDGLGWPMVLLHGPATEWALVNGQPRRVPVAGAVPPPTAVSSMPVSTSVATQRRRLRR